MFGIVVLHKSVSCGIFVLDKRQQETRKDVLIADAIHVAVKNTDVRRPLSRNSGPDMNLCVKHIACELQYWLCASSIKIKKRNDEELENSKFKRNNYTTVFSQ